MPPEPGAVAVLGAGGTMGRGMTRNLAAAGLAVRAWNRTPEKARDLADLDGVDVVATAREAVAGASIVITILADAEATLDAVGGDLLAAAPGAAWAQMATIGIEGTERCAALAAERGLGFVDAPVLGTRKPAEDGALTVLASGAEELRGPVAPVFDAVGSRTLWLGPAGAGSRLKVVVNAWILSVVEGAAEVVSLAEATGVDPAAALEALAGGPLDMPYLQMKGKAMIEREFPLSFRLDLAAKDAGLALAAAREAGVELPALEATSARFARAAGTELGAEDMAAIFLAAEV